jgi:hypothetical protein
MGRPALVRRRSQREDAGEAPGASGPSNAARRTVWSSPSSTGCRGRCSTSPGWFAAPRKAAGTSSSSTSTSTCPARTGSSSGRSSALRRNWSATSSVSARRTRSRLPRRAVRTSVARPSALRTSSPASSTSWRTRGVVRSRRRTAHQGRGAITARERRLASVHRVAHRRA